jgi:predicted nuclease with TOPRIM domain
MTTVNAERKMMDIVERLRERLTRVDAEYGLADEKLDREAIDEIERLRKENKELRKQLKHLDNRLTVLQGTQAAR